MLKETLTEQHTHIHNGYDRRVTAGRKKPAEEGNAYH